MEERLYRICAERGITCVTISHRPALEAFHHTKLALNGNPYVEQEEEGNIETYKQYMLQLENFRHVMVGEGLAGELPMHYFGQWHFQQPDKVAAD